jgi:branched-chain amino acid transport system ATP-binding protein
LPERIVLQVDALHAHYAKSHILHGVTLTLEAGEIVCLLGRNGVGKSTTLKSLMGLVKPSAGSVRFKGQDITGLPAYRVARLGLGYVPEERRIFPTISVKENLLMGIKPRLGAGSRGNGKAWTLERVYAFFPRLRERENQRAGTLSGGEQQMLTTGRTLMGNPEVLLVDEPTEGLAPMIVEQVERILTEIHRDGTPILLVEQALETALGLAHRVYVMSKGEIVFSGSTQELKANEQVRKQYLEV